jgi:uncharacterized protein (TIGR03435 family)
MLLAADGPQFEVASIKPAPPPEGRGMSWGTHYDKALYTANNVALRDLLIAAFKLKDYQLQCPSWMETARFNINAKVPEGMPKEEINPMLQTLLVQRFKMEVRRERKELPAFTLTVAKGGPKLKEAEPDSNPPAPAMLDGTAPGSVSGVGGSADMAAMMARRGPPAKDKDGYPIPGKVGMSSSGSNGHTKVAGSTQPMSALVQFLSRLLGREVVDNTGLAGKYDFRFEFGGSVPMPGMARSPVMPPPGATAPAEAADPDGPTIFKALQDQLGLKLEPGKTQMDFVVIEKAEKMPIEN